MMIRLLRERNQRAQLKARKETYAQQTSEAAEGADQEKAIYEEGVVGNHASLQGEGYAPRRAKAGVVIQQRRRNFESAVGGLGRFVEDRTGRFAECR
jgi:hypothetical protein